MIVYVTILTIEGSETKFWGDIKMKKSVFIIGLVAALAVAAALAGCAAQKPETPSQPSESQNAQISNPIVQYDDASAFESLGIAIDAPKNADGVSYSIIGGELAQVKFTVDGSDYTYRAQKTDEDISGLYVEFEDESVHLDATYDKGCVGVDIKSVKDSEGKLAVWKLDGTMFALYTESASTEAIQSVAMQLVEAQMQ